jgi:hypothetical protein
VAKARQDNGGVRAVFTAIEKRLPKPTPRFRRRAWRLFQAALDRRAARKPPS